VGYGNNINIVGTAPMLTGTAISGDTAFAASVAAAHASAMQVQPGGVSIAAEIGGMTFMPGIYRSATGISFSSTIITLDAAGDPNAKFLFQAETTLVVAAGRAVLLANGALSANVVWATAGSASIGTSTSFKGSILAGTEINIGGFVYWAPGGCALAVTNVNFSADGISLAGP
jgi:hypothetical protein